ncbi:substrate-binding periplasmic protein [Pseudoalteromonas ruthenica]|uniref:substrate-binding periplasmic protein n=1 Tax=Pseudoalteromonas ruthenica TaxID=151081 RepID=UPI00110A8B4C|nr:transporter substrate-binding domain-containing protein [Pseudoalteromonas ruthenica]TMO42591.1 hypothetical protein CWC24_17815 [Pseudoalteromonas ruthenica]TMO50535.1 hypothetical protein CWC23_11320 [Pseudoalteromonas ruthenica]
MVLRALLSALVFILSQHTHALERLELATEPFPPYFSNTLYQHGWMAHLVSEAFRSQNIVVRIHFTQWSRALRGTKKGKYSAVLGAYKTTARQQDFVFSAALAKAHSGFFRHAKSNRDFTGDLELVAQDPIAVGRDYGEEQLLINYGGIDYVELPNLSKALQLLERRRISWVLGPQEVGEHIIRELALSEHLMFDSPALSENTLHLAFARQHPLSQYHLKAFRSGMQSLLKQGRVADILAQHPLPPPQQQAVLSLLKQHYLDTGAPE